MKTVRRRTIAVLAATCIALTGFGVSQASAGSASSSPFNGWTKGSFVSAVAKAGVFTAEQAAAAWGDQDKMSTMPVSTSLEMVRATNDGIQPMWSLPAAGTCKQKWINWLGVEMANLTVTLHWEFGTIGAIYMGTDATPWAKYAVGWSFASFNGQEDYKNGLNWVTTRFAKFKFVDGNTSGTIWVRVTGYNDGSSSCQAGTP
ncbi:hypothetical protein [Psychromicrobium xiongbiense]|uniref:hypothetical protein n=1 Tax=Psychromicrobium xiongbiense TaxID=3051184 RepID=UPI00255279DB|nr:hypothetical protein [Psychromicrobium sp. YIM S02556]